MTRSSSSSAPNAPARRAARTRRSTCWLRPQGASRRRRRRPRSPGHRRPRRGRLASRAVSQQGRREARCEASCGVRLARRPGRVRAEAGRDVAPQRPERRNAAFGGPAAARRSIVDVTRGARFFTDLDLTMAHLQFSIRSRTSEGRRFGHEFRVGAFCLHSMSSALMRCKHSTSAGNAGAGLQHGAVPAPGQLRRVPRCAPSPGGTDYSAVSTRAATAFACPPHSECSTSLKQRWAAWAGMSFATRR